MVDFVAGFVVLFSCFSFDDLYKRAPGLDLEIPSDRQGSSDLVPKRFWARTIPKGPSNNVVYSFGAQIPTKYLL